MSPKPVLFLTVPGIGEAPGDSPTGMLANFTRALPPIPGGYMVQQFNWMNQYGPVPVWDGRSYADNKAQAVGALTRAIIAATKTFRVVPVGYSGGAHVVSETLAELGKISVQLPAVVLVSNPLRLEQDGSGPRDRYGIAGHRASFSPATRVFDLANPVDVICCCPPAPHPLRAFSDLTAHFSLADPVTWGVQLLETAKRGQFQNAWRLSSLPAWFDAVALARGYLFDGQHTSWYVPRLPALARQVAAVLSTPA